jgi:anaerobic magnesium-protoporphyrin IX monomethyl ester cyclase
MRALFIRPNNPSGSGYLRSFGFLPTPLGLLQLAGDVLSVNGWEARIIDMEADNMTTDDVISAAISYDPDIVGITLHATASHNVAIQIAKGIKNQLNDTVLIAGGHHATFVPYQMLNDGFDLVVLGEGDDSMIKIAQELKEGNRDFSKIRGIVYKREGKVIRNPSAPLISDLDSLPEPALDLVNRKYYTFKVFGDDQYVACLETARGCPYACDFCSVTPTWGNKWRNKSNSRILREITKAKELGYNWIFFVDDIFIVWPNRSQRSALFRQMIEGKNAINFIAQMRADVTARNPELIKLASDAGLRLAFLGIESGSQEMLKKMHKGLAVSDSVKAVKTLHENGVIVLVGLMLGAPYETLKDMRATIRLSRKLADVGADAVQFSIYTPLPGTRIFVDSLKNSSLFTLNWDQYDILTPVVKTKVNPALIQFIAVYANHSFYIYKYLKGKLRLSNLKIPDRKMKFLKNGEKYLWKKLPYFMKGTFIDLPLSAMKTLRMYFRKSKIPDDVIQSLIMQSSGIVYLDQGDKNRYYKIKND